MAPLPRSCCRAAHYLALTAELPELGESLTWSQAGMTVDDDGADAWMSRLTKAESLCIDRRLFRDEMSTSCCG